MSESMDTYVIPGTFNAALIYICVLKETCDLKGVDQILSVSIIAQSCSYPQLYKGINFSIFQLIVVLVLQPATLLF